MGRRQDVTPWASRSLEPASDGIPNASLTYTLGSFRGMFMMNRKNPTVLLVEDDADERAVLTKLLRNAGYSVHEADNGQAGADRIKEGDIDILVTDLRLPFVG